MKLNNKGFTLVEVIAVVGIITMLALILIPNVTKLINKQKKNSEDSIKNTILVAAEEYVNDNRYRNIDINSITVEKLINEGYITPTKGNSIVNPSDKNKCLNNNKLVTIEPQKVNDKIKSYKYSIEIQDSDWGICN